MPCESVVRIAGAEDEADLWRLFLMVHKENGLFTLNPEKVRWFMRRCLCPELIDPNDPGVRGVIGVIGKVGQLEGFAFLTIGEFWYTSQKHLEEYVVFTDPECRKSDHAKALIDWMKQQSEQPVANTSFRPMRWWSGSEIWKLPTISWTSS